MTIRFDLDTAAKVRMLRPNSSLGWKSFAELSGVAQAEYSKQRVQLFVQGDARLRLAPRFRASGATKSGVIVPTVLRVGGYRFFFYANENSEPVHIHVQRERMLAKFWLQPVALARSSGFAAHELKELIGLIEEHQHAFVEAWNEFFGV